MRVAEELDEIAQAHELGAQAERVLHLERVPISLRGGPEEKNERDRDLRREQRIRQPLRPEDNALFHLPFSLSPPRLAGRGRGGVPWDGPQGGEPLQRFADSNLRKISLPRLTASSSAVFASFLPANTASSSSSITSRPWT